MRVRKKTLRKHFLRVRKGRQETKPAPEVQKEIDKIKKLLKEKTLLPYLPREKKERRMP
jgi:hypothetical protein